ncbi:MAG: hypothetical protein RL367_1721 [Pseudomonadota bacterium]
MIKSFAAIAAGTVLAAIPVAATSLLPSPVSPARYSVAIKVFDGGKLTASPNRTIKAGEPAQFVSGNNREYFQLVATPTAPDRFHLNSNLVQWTPAGLMNDAETLETGVNGKPAIIILGKYDAKSGKLRPLRIEVSINRVTRTG